MLSSSLFGQCDRHESVRGRFEAHRPVAPFVVEQEDEVDKGQYDAQDDRNTAVPHEPAADWFEHSVEAQDIPREDQEDAK
jgi:hypothetical protein